MFAEAGAVDTQRAANITTKQVTDKIIGHSLTKDKEALASLLLKRWPFDKFLRVPSNIWAREKGGKEPKNKKERKEKESHGKKRNGWVRREKKKGERNKEKKDTALCSLFIQLIVIIIIITIIITIIAYVILSVRCSRYSKGLKNNMKKAGTTISVELFQKTAILGTAHILKRVLESS